MTKIVIKILQGTADMQNALGELITYPLVANFLQYACAKKCENLTRYVNILSKDRVGFLRHGINCMHCCYVSSCTINTYCLQQFLME